MSPFATTILTFLIAVGTITLPQASASKEANLKKLQKNLHDLMQMEHHGCRGEKPDKKAWVRTSSALAKCRESSKKSDDAFIESNFCVWREKGYLHHDGKPFADEEDLRKNVLDSGTFVFSNKIAHAFAKEIGSRKCHDEFSKGNTHEENLPVLVCLTSAILKVCSHDD